MTPNNQENNVSEEKNLNWFKSWFFVPNFQPVIVTDYDKEKKMSFHRKLENADFQWTEKGVPNYGVLTFVGISEIWKEITSLQSQVKAYRAIAIESEKSLYFRIYKLEPSQIEVEMRVDNEAIALSEKREGE